MGRTTEPTQEFISQVKELVNDDEIFEEEGLSELMAYACWRHDEPIPAESIEQGLQTFSDTETSSINDWLDKADAYFASVENEDTEGNSDMGTNNYSAQSPNAFGTAVGEALGLSSGTTEQQILNAIRDLQASSFSEDEKASLLDIERRQRIFDYQEQTSKLDVIPGSPVELAEKLVDLETKIGTGEAESRLAEWQAMQTMTDEAGVTSTILASNHSEDASANGPAKAKITAYAEENKLDMPAAIVHFATNDKNVFNAYRKEEAEA